MACRAYLLKSVNQLKEVTSKRRVANAGTRYLTSAGGAPMTGFPAASTLLRWSGWIRCDDLTGAQIIAAVTGPWKTGDSSKGCSYFEVRKDATTNCLAVTVSQPGASATAAQVVASTLALQASTWHFAKVVAELGAVVFGKGRVEFTLDNQCPQMFALDGTVQSFDLARATAVSFLARYLDATPGTVETATVWKGAYAQFCVAAERLDHIALNYNDAHPMAVTDLYPLAPVVCDSLATSANNGTSNASTKPGPAMAAGGAGNFTNTA